MAGENDIYTFLKDNGLTSKDENTFKAEYADPKKAEELHRFFTDNGLTSKDSTAFYDTYFKPEKGGTQRTPATPVSKAADVAAGFYESAGVKPMKENTYDPNAGSTYKEGDVFKVPDQKAAAASTEVVKKPRITESPAEKKIADEAVEGRKQFTDEAISRAAKDYLKAKGINAEPGSTQYWNAVGDMRMRVMRGEAYPWTDPSGKPGLKGTTKALDDIASGYKEATQGVEEAKTFNSLPTEADKVAWLEKKRAENPHPEYIGMGENETLKMLGGSIPLVAKGTAAAVVGGMINTASGGTLAGVTPTLMFAVTGYDAIQQRAMSEVVTRYDAIRNENPTMPAKEAMREANKGRVPGALMGGVEAAAFSGLGVGKNSEALVNSLGERVAFNLNRPITDNALQVVAKAAGRSFKAGAVMSGITTAADAGLIADRALSGVKVKNGEQELANTAEGGFTAGFLLHGLTSELLPGAAKLGKLAKSSFKYGLVESNTPPAEIETALKANEDLGNIPPGSTEKVMGDIAAYKVALDKTPQRLAPEVRASVAGLVQAKEKIMAERATKDPATHSMYDDEIKAIDNQITGMIKTGKVDEFEINEATGKTYAEEQTGIAPPDHPKVEAIKIELKVDHDKPTIAAFDQRTADAVRESEPVVKSIEVGAESEREADLTKAIREGEAFIEREKAAGANAEAEGNKSGGGEEKPEGGEVGGVLSQKKDINATEFSEVPFDKESYQDKKTIDIGGEDFEYSRLKGLGENNVFIIEKNGEEIGKATLSENGNFFTNIRIDEKYRRRGLATKMYDYVEGQAGIKLEPSHIKQSPEASKLWEKRQAGTKPEPSDAQAIQDRLSASAKAAKELADQEQKVKDKKEISAINKKIETAQKENIVFKKMKPTHTLSQAEIDTKIKTNDTKIAKLKKQLAKYGLQKSEGSEVKGEVDAKNSTPITKENASYSIAGTTNGWSVENTADGGARAVIKDFRKGNFLNELKEKVVVARTFEENGKTYLEVIKDGTDQNGRRGGMQIVIDVTGKSIDLSKFSKETLGEASENLMTQKDVNTFKDNVFNVLSEQQTKTPTTEPAGIGPMSQGGVGVMERNKALTTQRIKPVTQTPTDKPVQLNQAIGDLAKDLDAVLVYSKSSRRSAGDYNPANGLQRIRRAGDLDTTAHETGHFLDDRFNILNQLTPKAKGELDWFSQRGGSNPPKQYTPAQQAEYLQREGLAEYIRARAVNPAEAAKQAPELAKEFDALIDDKAKAALQKFSDRVINFSNAPAGDKIIANVQMSPVIKDKTTAVEWLKSLSQKPDELKISWLDDLQDQMIDGLHTAKKAYQYANKVNGVQTLLPEQNFETLSRLVAGVNGKVDRMLESGLVDSKNNVLKDNGEAMTTKWLFDPLAKNDIKTLEAEQQEVIKLLIAERTMEYAGKFGRTDNLSGIGGGLKSDMDVATEHINDFAQLKQTDPAKYARIKEGARRYRAFANTVLDYALEKGRISQEQYDAIKDSNQFYVAMTRIGELAPGEEPLSAMTNYTKGGVASVKQILRKAKGGTGLIQNPYVSLLKNTVDIIAEADRNEVMQSFVEPLLASRKMGQGDLKMLSAIGREVDASETKNAKTVYINGEPRKFQFDKDIYESLTRMQDLSTSNIFGKVFMTPGKILRWSVTHYPVFAARNIVRDFTSRVVLSRSGSGIKTLLHDATDRQLFDLYGGSQAGHHLINRDAYYKTLAETSKEMVKNGGIILSPKKLASGYTKFLEKGENVNRIAEFKAAYAKAKKAGMDDYNAGLQAAFEARDLMDFAVGGHVMKTINKFIPFTNAAMQGLRRSAVGIKENPGKFGLRVMLYTVVPTLMQRALVHNNGDDEEYEQLPPYMRDLFWNFKIPGFDKWISIPKPFDIGLPASFVDRTISKAQGEDNAYEGFTHSVINVMTPFDEGSLMGPMRSVIEPMVNKNMFLDQPIVPQYEEKLMLSKREKANEASRLGKALSDGFGLFGSEVDPRMIDHVIKSNASYYGDVALRLSDIGRADSHNKFGVGQTGFMKDKQISNAKDVSATYDLAEKLGAFKTADIKTLGDMIRDYYGLKTDKERIAAAKALYAFSKKVRTELEAEYKKEKSK